MSRRNRRQPKTAQPPTDQLQRLVAAEVERRLSQMALPPGAKPRALNQDALMMQMQAQQSPEKQGTPMFSPGAPLQPSPGLVNPQGPRTYATFPVGYNIQSQPRSTEATSFDTLRNLAALYDGIQLCEQVWLDTVAKLTLTIKPRDEIIAEQGKSAATQKYAKKIRQYADFFAYPDVGNGYDLKAWLRAAVRDQLQLDAVSIYVRRNRGGGVYSLELVDGSSIKPLIDSRGRRPAPPFPAYQQFLYGVPAGLYTSDEMLYQRETVRTESIYGLSRVERIILRINQALRKENKDLSRFTDGNIPPGILTPPDDGSQWTPEQLLAYQEMWDALLAGNDQVRSKIKVIQPGSSITSLQEPDIFIDFDRFLLNVTAACYSMTMADLGFTESVNKSSGESQENVFYRRAVQPLMDRYATLFTFVLRYYFGEQDLVVSWSGFEESEDFNANSASYVSLVSAGIVSPTTAAHMLNIPWSGPEIPNYVLTKDGMTFLEDAADPAIRKAANDAKMAGFNLAANPPAQPPDNAASDEQATKSGEKQRTPPGSVENQGGRGRKSPPPASGAKDNEEDEDQPVKRADDSNELRPEVLQHHTGMMIAFMVKPEIAEELALPDGEPAQDLHCTLCFLGDMHDAPPDGYVSPVETLDALRLLLASFAKNQDVLSGTTGGVGRFSPSPSSDEASPVIALVNVPGLQDFRRKLVETLNVAGYYVHNDFDYTPHCTLAYINANDPLPIDDIPVQLLVFDELCLAIGDDRYFFPVGRDNPDPTSRAEIPDVVRSSDANELQGLREWRAPSKTQLALETKLAKAIKNFIDLAQVTRDGATPPDETAQTKLLDEITDALTEAIHEGRRIATQSDERALISAVQNLAGRAVQVVSDIIDQLTQRAQDIIDDIFGGGDEDIDPDEALAEVEDELDTWAAEYSEMVAETEVSAAVEDAVLAVGVELGHTEKYWNAEPGACKACIANMEASPIPIAAMWGDGSTGAPAHPHCRCSISTNAATLSGALTLRHMQGKHDQKTHGNKYSYGVDENGNKTRKLAYKGGSGGLKGKGTPMQIADTGLSGLTAAAMKQATQDFAHLLDQKNTKEQNWQTKARIEKEMAARLEGNQEFAALVDRMKETFHEPDMTTSRACDLLVRQWAVSSGDSQELSVAMQAVAHQAFHLDGAQMPYDSSVLANAEATYGGVKQGMAAFLKAQYAYTQEWFAAQGISEVTLYRGADWNNGNPYKPAGIAFPASGTHAATVSASLQPMSSFATDPKEALSFASGANNLLVGARVPVSRILTTCQTGYGCKKESEMVVLGRQQETMYGISWRGSNGSGASGVYKALSDLSQQDATITKADAAPAMVHLDADLHNADWTKRSWDLGIENIDALRSYLASAQMTPQEFMTLPVYQHNASKLPWLRDLQEDAARADAPAFTAFAQPDDEMARHMQGKHDQKTHGNKYSYSVDPATGKKTRTLIYKGGSGGAKGKNGGKGAKTSGSSKANAVDPRLTRPFKGDALAGKPLHEREEFLAQQGGDAWLKSLSSDEAHALFVYTTNAYSTINQGLRSGNPPDHYAKAISDANAALLKNSAPEDMLVKRGVSNALFSQFAQNVGKTFVDKGFTSTTIKESPTFGSTELTIHVFKGAPGGYVAPISDFSTEREWLLPAGAHFKVLSATNNMGKNQVVLEYRGLPFIGGTSA